MEFSGSLLREKFVISEGKGEEVSGDPMIVVSNRMVVPLLDASGQVGERFVIRGQYMHSCIRMAARLIHTFMDKGPILVRDSDPFDWENAWLRLIEDHDQKYHPDMWLAVYANGKPIYEYGEHHMFLDVLEQCDYKHADNYDAAIEYAEKIFEQYGKTITINHDAGVALVVNLKDNEGRCGVVLRGAEKTTTFNYRVSKKGKDGDDVFLPQLIGSCAAFLEGIQLSFSIGMVNEQLRQEVMTRADAKAREANSSRSRLAKMNAQINALEQNYEVRYRPEKPIFSEMVIAAEELMAGILEEQRLKEAMENEEWVDDTPQEGDG